MICFSCRWAFTLWILADTKLGAPTKDHARNSKGENDTLFNYERPLYGSNPSPLPRFPADFPFQVCFITDSFTRVWKGILGIPAGFDRNTVRERGKRKMSWRDRDLTTTKETGFAKMLTRAALLGKRAVFGIEITEIRDMTRDSRELGNAGSGSHLPDPCLTMTLTLNQYH